MKRTHWKILLLSILIPTVCGLAVGFITSPCIDYHILLKPPLSPPGWLFGLVWPILYIVMGISCYLICKSGHPEKEKALLIYLLQLFVNLLWMPIFFCLKWRLFAFIWILLLIILVLRMIVDFYKIDQKAAFLQIPYAVWIFFAAYLNLGIYLLNG